MKAKTIQVRVSLETHARLSEDAGRAGVRFSEWVRGLLGEDVGVGQALPAVGSSLPRIVRTKEDIEKVIKPGVKKSAWGHKVDLSKEAQTGKKKK